MLKTAEMTKPFLFANSIDFCQPAEIYYWIMETQSHIETAFIRLYRIFDRISERHYVEQSLMELGQPINGSKWTVVLVYCTTLYTSFELPIKIGSSNFNTLQQLFLTSVHLDGHCTYIFEKLKNVQYSYRELHHSIRKGLQKSTIFYWREVNTTEKRGTYKTSITSIERKQIP